MGIFNDRLGMFGALSRGINRLSNPLSDPEMKEVLRGRARSDLAGYYFGHLYPPRLGTWTNGLLAIFNDGSGGVFWDLAPSNLQTTRKFSCEQAWDAGQPRPYDDPTPLLVGKGAFPLDEAQSRYMPKRLPSQDFMDKPVAPGEWSLLPGEMVLVFENFSNDYAGGEDNSYITGASHKPETVFMGVVVGRGASLLRARCAGRQAW